MRMGGARSNSELRIVCGTWRRNRLAVLVHLEGVKTGS